MYQDEVKQKMGLFEATKDYDGPYWEAAIARPRAKDEPEVSSFFRAKPFTQCFPT